MPRSEQRAKHQPDRKQHQSQRQAELTLDNYRKIFDLYYVRLFGRTLRLGLITTAVCVVLGYPLAYFLARAMPRVQALCLFLLIMPLMVSAVIRVFGWIVILGRKGLVNQALVALGLEPVSCFTAKLPS
jgi:putative spermidine/putrescine transport system permease protein